MTVSGKSAQFAALSDIRDGIIDTLAAATQNTSLNVAEVQRAASESVPHVG